MPWIKYLKASVSLAGCKYKEIRLCYNFSQDSFLPELRTGGFWQPHVVTKSNCFNFADINNHNVLLQHFRWLRQAVGMIYETFASPNLNPNHLKVLPPIWSNVAFTISDMFVFFLCFFFMFFGWNEREKIVHYVLMHQFMWLNYIACVTVIERSE